MNQASEASAASETPRREPLAFLDARENLRCPVDLKPLEWNAHDSVLISSEGARRYPVVDGIPCLFAPNQWPDGKSDVTDMVKSFYEETPFPNYDDLDGRESLQTKARRGVFARLLDEQIPRGAKVLEAGCGTGQLSNFLGMGWERTVIGADLCLHSLGLAKSFRDRCSINNVNFLWFDQTQPLETLVFQSNIHRFIGIDVSAGVEYRPLLNNQMVFVAGIAALDPGQGFRDLYNPLVGGVDTMVAGFLNAVVAY